MCQHSDDKHELARPSSYPANLLPRNSPPTLRRVLWTPLEGLMVGTTACISLAGLAAPSRLNLPVPGVMAAVVQGLVVLLHGSCEGPRSQLLAIYVSVPLLALNAMGVLGHSAGVTVAIGAVTLLLGSFSLVLCYFMPKLFPISARGPYAVAIATEHIRTPVENPGTKMAAGQEECRPLELMAQVFYPVDKSCVADLPWFPSSIARFRRSLVPAWGGAHRVRFGLTQAGILGSSIIWGTAASRCRAELSSPGGFPSSSTLVTDACAWAVLAAVAMCVTCFVSDMMMGSSRAAYQARYLEREQAKRIAMFAGMPGWLTEHVCGFYAKGFEAGHFYGPDVPCFPAAPIKAGDRKRPVVLFSHGLGGNRALYAELAGEIASHGYVVVAMEHNDASGSSCMFPDGRLTPYIPGPNVAQIASQDNREYRLAQLRRRGREVQLVRAHLKKLELGVDTDFEGCRRVGLGSVIDTKRPAYVGHSFGGASVLQGLSDERFGEQKEDKDEKGFSMAFIMDPWTFPLSDEACDHRIDIPVVIMTTETFLGAEGTAREDHITHNAISTVRDGSNDLAMQLRVKDVEHNNFSDSALFSPEIMRKLGNAGKMDGIAFLDQMSRLIICALEVFLRRRTAARETDKSSPPPELSSVLLGSDLSVVFPEARVRRGCAAGVLPSMEKHNG